MDKPEFVINMEIKIHDTSTYKEIFEDPTSNIQRAIADQLNRLEETSEMDSVTHLKLRPT